MSGAKMEDTTEEEGEVDLDTPEERGKEPERGDSRADTFDVRLDKEREGEGVDSADNAGDLVEDEKELREAA